MQCQRPGNPGEANDAGLNSSNLQPIRLCSTGLVTPTLVAMDNVSLCLPAPVTVDIADPSMFASASDGAMVILL